MDLPRLKIPPRLREAMAYDKLAGGIPRLMILEGQYWLDAACRNAAQTMGWDVRSVPVRLEGVLPRDHVEELLRGLAEFRPDFILSINLGGMDVDGIFARLFEDLSIPYVSWFVDEPRTIVMGRTTYATPCSVALTWERSYMDDLRRAGFPVVAHLPMAADPSLFDSPPAEDWSCPPTFVANSMSVPAEREWAWVNERPALAEAVRAVLDAGHLTRERFAEGLETLFDPAFLAGLDVHERRHAELLLFVEGTRRLRWAAVETLADEGLELRGDDGWQASRLRAGPPVSYAEDLAAFYRDCELNFNITSIQMASAVNQRIFDCPAAGGFLLTDAQGDLELLFDVDHEVARYTSLEDLAIQFRWFRARPHVRREIASRARERIMQEHTYAHRLKAIAEIVRTHFGA